MRLGPSSAAPLEEGEAQEIVLHETKDSLPFVNIRKRSSVLCVAGIGMASPIHLFVEVWTRCFLLGHDSGARYTRMGISTYESPEI
jgi:hypothetical protein